MKNHKLNASNIKNRLKSNNKIISGYKNKLKPKEFDWRDRHKLSNKDYLMNYKLKNKNCGYYNKSKQDRTNNEKDYNIKWKKRDKFNYKKLKEI